MPEALLPFMDGEAIPDERFDSIFRSPPGVPTAFHRSALLIGARGVGKTTLFRHVKARHEGIACHINLTAELGSITKQAGLGALSTDAPKDVSDLMSAKAACLVLAVVADRLAKRGVALESAGLADFLPSTVLPKRRRWERTQTKALMSSLAQLDLRAFEPLAYGSNLPRALTYLAQAGQTRQGPLLLLFDRADQVAPNTLLPVFDALDQSEGYVALVALRPGHAGDVLGRSVDAATAGDHFGVVHLGAEPYAPEWQTFVLSAVEAQVGASGLARLGHSNRQFLGTLARDSVRFALEVASRCNGTGADERAFARAVGDAKDNMLTACHAKLHVDFRRVVSDVRSEILASAGRMCAPVVLTVRETRPRLFDSSSRLDRYLLAALRCGGLVMPHGTRWAPGMSPEQLEVPPLLLWQEGDAAWSPSVEDTITVSRSPSSLMGSRGGSAPAISVFVAYRMNVPESIRFRERFEDLLVGNPSLEGVTVVDGRVRAGERWAESIKSRLKNSKVVVGDVTGLRPEVTFELGYGYGLRRPLVPVVGTAEDLDLLPRWLTSLHVGTYQDQVALTGVVTSVLAQIAERRIGGLPRLPEAVPGVAVLLGDRSWTTEVAATFKAAAARAGLRPEILSDDDDDEHVMERALRASLLILRFNRGALDSLALFIAGAVVARPMIGHGAKMLRRQIVAVVDDTDDLAAVAEGLRRNSQVVQLLRSNRFGQAIERFGDHYLSWMRPQSTNEDEGHK